MSKKIDNSFYDLVLKDEKYLEALASATPESIKNYNNIIKPLRFPLRPYQLEALRAFQLYYEDDFDSKSLKKKTINSIADNGKTFEWPQIGFEMATGSGKTLLMGAIIMDLLGRGHKDFLIFTPNTILFDKTINNFTPRNIKSIFGDGWNLSYNLVTGNSYRDKTCNYEEGRDISFYIFNIQKFYEKASNSSDSMKGLPYIRRPLEESLWKDEAGQNTISFTEFLKTKRPVIISDEAHHYQQKETKNAIFELLPSSVFEFTATSVEKNVNSEHGQNNIYKYPMQRFISEGYGKRIFAVGSGSADEKVTEEFNDNDKQKLIWGMLIHLLKKEALKTVKAPLSKPMMLIRARSIKHADNIDGYLKSFPDNVGTEIDDVLDQVNREQKDLAKMLRKYVLANKSKLLPNLKTVANSVFTIHSQNKKTEDTWTDYQTLEDNDAEIVNQVEIFTEGVDYDHFYTIVVMADTVENVGFAAAQLIGRGLRLYKEKREYDILEHDIKEESEILHIVCERGKRFDKIVDEIRKKLKLSEGTIEIPTEEKEKENKVNAKLLDDYKLPILKIKSVATGLTFQEALKNKKLSAESFINEVAGVVGGEKILKPEVMAMVDYAEITSDKIEFQQDKPKTDKRTLTLSDEEATRWALDFIEQTGSFIGNNASTAILERIKAILNYGIQVEMAYQIDYKKAKKALHKSIIKFYSDNAYHIMFKNSYEFKQESVKSLFKDNTIIIRSRDGNTINLMPSHQPMSGHLLRKGIVVEGYKHSIRPYVKFDSPPEKWVADALEKLCSKDKTGKSFWVRNEPRTEYGVEVRPAPFYPDFLAYINKQWSVVDVKGSHLAEAKQIDNRKRALKLLEEKGGLKTFFLVDDIMEKKGFSAQDFKSIDDFAGFDELHSSKIKWESLAEEHIPSLFDKKDK